MRFIGDCTYLRGRDITEMTDNSIEVTARTFRKNIGSEEYKRLQADLGYGDCPGLTLASDYAVSFYRSKYKGRRCYYVDHSGIEYVFTN